MKRYTHEFYESLIEQHRFVNATINEIFVNGKYSREHNHIIISTALDQLRVQKVILEAQINVMHEFLN